VNILVEASAVHAMVLPFPEDGICGPSSSCHFLLGKQFKELPTIMKSRTVSGLFLIGEVVDVTGHLGCLNFQWAWASGAAAGRSV